MQAVVVEREFSRAEQGLYDAALAVKAGVAATIEQPKLDSAEVPSNPAHARVATPVDLRGLEKEAEIRLVKALLNQPLLDGQYITVKDDSHNPLVFTGDGFQVIWDGRHLELPTAEDLRDLWISRNEARSAVLSAGLIAAKRILAGLGESGSRGEKETDLTRDLRIHFAVAEAA